MSYVYALFEVNKIMMYIMCVLQEKVAMLAAAVMNVTYLGGN